MQRMFLLPKTQRVKDSRYLDGFWREKEVFLFFEKDKSETRLAIAQKAHALFKEPQNNRELTK